MGGFLLRLRREGVGEGGMQMRKQPQIKKTRQEWKLLASLVGFMIAGLVMFIGITNIRAGEDGSNFLLCGSALGMVIGIRNDNLKLTTCDNRILTTPSVGRSAGQQGFTQREFHYQTPNQHL